MAKQSIATIGSCEVVTTISDKLLTKKRRLELELADVNSALDALNANPEIDRVLTLVGKAVGRSF